MKAGPVPKHIKTRRSGCVSGLFVAQAPFVRRLSFIFANIFVESGARAKMFWNLVVGFLPENGKGKGVHPVVEAVDEYTVMIR